MDIPDFKTCKVIKIEFNKQIIDRWDSKIDFRVCTIGDIAYPLSFEYNSPSWRLAILLKNAFTAFWSCAFQSQQFLRHRFGIMSASCAAIYRKIRSPF